MNYISELKNLIETGGELKEHLEWFYECPKSEFKFILKELKKFLTEHIYEKFYNEYVTNTTRGHTISFGYIFYTYKLTHVDGHFYIGRRQTCDEPEKDKYWGSGTLLWELYKTQGISGNNINVHDPSDWTKEILTITNDLQENIANECELIKTNRINPLCLNRTHKSPIPKTEQKQLDQILVTRHKERYSQLRKERFGGFNANCEERWSAKKLSNTELQQRFNELEQRMLAIVCEMEIRKWGQ